MFEGGVNSLYILKVDWKKMFKANVGAEGRAAQCLRGGVNMIFFIYFKS